MRFESLRVLDNCSPVVVEVNEIGSVCDCSLAFLLRYFGIIGLSQRANALIALNLGVEVAQVQQESPATI